MGAPGEEAKGLWEATKGRAAQEGKISTEADSREQTPGAKMLGCLPPLQREMLTPVGTVEIEASSLQHEQNNTLPRRLAASPPLPTSV